LAALFVIHPFLDLSIGFLIYVIRYFKVIDDDFKSFEAFLIIFEVINFYSHILLNI